nr:MAG TPA: hypothetical protein [Bacteriophage sp.]
MFNVYVLIKNVPKLLSKYGVIATVVSEFTVNFVSYLLSFFPSLSVNSSGLSTVIVTEPSVGLCIKSERIFK